MSLQNMVSASGPVVGRANGYQLQYVTPWMVLYGGSTLMTSVDIRAIETNADIVVGWRTASVLRELPNAWNVAGTSRTTNGGFPEGFDVSAQTSALWVQAGVFAGLTTGTTPKTAQTRLWASVIGGGFLLTQQQVRLDAIASNRVVLLGGPVCAAGISGLMIGLTYYGIAGTIVSPAFLWRGFDTGDERFPNSWSTIATGSNVSSDTQVNASGSVSTGSVQMLQPAVQYSTSGTNPNGVADITIAAKQ